MDEPDDITIDMLLTTQDAPFDPARAWRAQRRLRIIHRAMGAGQEADPAEAQRIEAILKQMGITGTVLRLPSALSTRLIKQVKQMSARSVRAGAGPIQLTMLGHGHFAPVKWPAARAGCGEPDAERVSMAEYEWAELTGPAVRVGAFEILARLIPGETPDAPQAIRRLPSLSGQASGLAVEGWTGRPQVCEHCQTMRRRSATYLVWDEGGGAIRQIGKSCLADYTGARLTDALLRRAEQYQELLRELTDPAGPWQAPKTARFVGHRIDNVLLACAVLARQEDGYHTRASLSFYEASKATAPRAWELLEAGTLASIATEADRRAAAAVRAFIDQLDGDDDHHAAIQAAAALPYATRRSAGTLGSAFALMQQMGKDATEAEQLDEFYGHIGERMELELRVVRALDLEGDSGERYWLIIARDNDGRHFRLSRRRPDMDVGGTYTLTATIKAHDESEEHGRVTGLRNPRSIHERMI